MNLSLNSQMRKLIEGKVRSGRYASAADVVRAGLEALGQQERFGSFSPGELDALLLEGERSLGRKRGILAEAVFNALHRRSQERRSSRSRKNA